MEPVSATYFIPRYQSPQQIIHDQRFLEFQPWLNGEKTVIPRLPSFRLTRFDHPAGRIIWIHRGKQTVMSIAGARTYAAAAELWQELFAARHQWNEHSNPAGWKQSRDSLWFEHTRLDLSVLTAVERKRLHEFVAPLMYALIREQLELAQGSLSIRTAVTGAH